MSRDIDDEINWGKLFLKVIIVFIVILLVIWLISKFVGKGSNTTSTISFDTALNKMVTASEKYFSNDENLPKEGKSKTVTLGDLINKKYTKKIVYNNVVCSNSTSFAKTTENDGEYTMKVTLKCGKKTKSTTKVIKSTKKDESNNNSNNSESSNSESNNGSSSSNNSSSEGESGNSNGNVSSPSSNGSSNITARSFKFCKINYNDYYIVLYENNADIKSNATFTYKVKLNNINNASKLSVIDNSNFKNKSQYNLYLKNKDNNFETDKSAKDYISDYKDFVNYSLKSSEFSYTLSDIYTENNAYYINITVTTKKEVSRVNDKKVNYIPVYIRLSYANTNDCVNDTYANSYKYSNYYVINE